MTDSVVPLSSAGTRGCRLSRRAVAVSALASLAAGLAGGCGSLPTSSFRPDPTVVPPLPTPFPAQFLDRSPRPDASPARARPAERIRIVLPALPPDLEPLRDDGELNRLLLRTVFDPLVVRDDGGRVVPGLADSYRNLDPLTWRLTLRERVPFANGAVVTVDDVRYSIERAAERQPAFGGRSWLASIRRVEILDSTTIHVVTRDPDPLVPARLVAVPIVPREQHQRLGEAGFAASPVGTGPFRLRERTPDRLVLEAVDTTWRGRPLCRELVLQQQPDPLQRVNLLLGGQVDLAYDLPIERVRELRDAGVQVVPSPQQSTLVVEITYLTGGPLVDRRVRQAINYAIDKQAIVRQQLGGFGQIAQGQLLVPGVTGYAPAVRAYPFDPQRARELLKEAGLPPGGVILKLDTLGGTYLNIAETVVAGLNRVGLPTTIQLLEPPEHAERAQRGGRSPLFLLPLSYARLLDADEVYERYLSTAPPESRRFANDEFDRLFARSRTEIDPTARGQTLERLARIFHEDAPLVFLANEFLAHGLAPGITGFSRQADGVIELEKLGAAQ